MTQIGNSKCLLIESESNWIEMKSIWTNMRECDDRDWGKVQSFPKTNSQMESITIPHQRKSIYCPEHVRQRKHHLFIERFLTSCDCSGTDQIKKKDKNDKNNQTKRIDDTDHFVRIFIIIQENDEKKI